MLAGNEFQSLGRAIVKEDEYEEVRWDGIINIVSWRVRVLDCGGKKEWLDLTIGEEDETYKVGLVFRYKARTVRRPVHWIPCKTTQEGPTQTRRLLASHPNANLNTHLREEQRLKVFENKVLRKIFATKRDEVTGEWRKLHNTELHALYSSPDIIRKIKFKSLRWAGHVVRMGESRNAYRVLDLRQKDLWEDRDVDGRIIFK
ncbi:hypothetical protein ANN_16110 [Periplaneta americana]|uniref:Uncharacterized protein n=1 Tax=Periplaneta americana TaxID=6978 RepID=A0ABQ8SI20_PERAM|nr:hypothetical protein ANN_16110 [Periplaneta americana]